MFYRLKFWLNDFKRFASKQPLSRVLLVAAALIVALALAIEGAIRPEPSPFASAEIAAIKDRGVLRVALRSDLPGFSYKDPTTGEWSGIEPEVATAIAQEIFGESGHVEFVESTSRILLRLNKGDADIALGQLPTTNTSYAYTGAYYTDAYAAMTLSGSPLTSLYALAGKVIGVVQDADSSKPDEPPAMQALTEWGEGEGQTYRFVVFASYPELMEALFMSAIDAALMRAAYMPKYYGEATAALPEAVSQIGYCAAVRKANGGLAAIASSAVAKMKESGALEALRVKYQLPKFGESAQE